MNTTDETWEDWQDHSVSEPIVIAKAGQKINVWEKEPYELKQDRT